MSGIRGRDTRWEVALRKGLFRRGFRYRTHSTAAIGKPDILFPKYRAAVFVHGCFWHGHDCHLFRVPTTRREFWTAKIERNRTRDRDVTIALAKTGWRQLIVWECAVRGKCRFPLDAVIDEMEGWLTKGHPSRELRGRPPLSVQ